MGLEAEMMVAFQRTTTATKSDIDRDPGLMSALAQFPSVRGMKKITTLSWPLIIGLGALALIRPLVRIIGHRVDADLGAATPIAITLVISAIWVAVVGIGKTRHPVMTLLFTGLTYAVLSIILSGILSPMIDGRLDGPLANPIAIVPMLLTNALWGLIAGGLALLIQRLRGVKPAENIERY